MDDTTLVIHSEQWMPTSEQTPVSPIEQHLTQIRTVLDKEALRASLEKEVGHKLSEQEVEEQQLTIWSQRVQYLVQVVEIGLIQLGILLVEGEKQGFYRRFPGSYTSMQDLFINGLHCSERHYRAAINAYQVYTYASEFGLSLEEICSASQDHIKYIGQLRRDVRRQREELEQCAVQVYARQHEIPESDVSYKAIDQLPAFERKEVKQQAEQIYRDTMKARITTILGIPAEAVREDIAASGGDYSRPTVILPLRKIAPNSVGGYSLEFGGGVVQMTRAQWDAAKHGQILFRIRPDGSAEALDLKGLGQYLEKVEECLPSVAYDEDLDF